MRDLESLSSLYDDNASFVTSSTSADGEASSSSDASASMALLRDWARRLDAEIGNLRRLLSLSSSSPDEMSDDEGDAEEKSFGRDLKEACRCGRHSVNVFGLWLSSP